MDDKTILVSIMGANNEIGVLQPVREIGQLCHERGVLFHTDAVQSVGKVPFNVIDDNVDLASISAHKIYGPKGVGALYVRRKNPRVQLVAQIDGGGHERGMRSGTLNVPGIVGLGKACELCDAGAGGRERHRSPRMRDSLKQQLFAELDEIYVNGSMEHRLPGNLNRQLRLRGRRVAADGHQRCRRLQRFGLHFGHARALVRAQGAGHRRRAGA